VRTVPLLRCADFYRTVHQWFADAGHPDAIPAHLGHGVGIGDDTLPSIVPTSEDTFVEGEVVCVEPGVYVRGLGGVRIEDTVVVRATGCEILSLAPRITYRPG
jgi:Xaa-Pro aminopeptidase